MQSWHQLIYLTHNNTILTYARQLGIMQSKPAAKHWTRLYRGLHNTNSNSKSSLQTVNSFWSGTEVKTTYELSSWQRAMSFIKDSTASCTPDRILCPLTLTTLVPTAGLMPRNTLWTYSRVAPASCGYDILNRKYAPNIRLNAARGVSTDVQTTFLSTISLNAVERWKASPSKHKQYPVILTAWLIY